MKKNLADADKREQAIKALETEIGTLKERIGNGKEKIGQQKQLISEAERSKKILDESLAGKKAYEQAETRLAELREKVKVQRQLEQEVATLKTRFGKLEERFRSDSTAVERINEEISGEETGLSERRKALSVDEKQQSLADRLPEIRLSLEQMRNQLGLLEGRRAGLEEGSEKLAEGICPFFQEPCLNIAERPPGDFFPSKFEQLDKDKERLTEDLKKLREEESTANKAGDQIKEVAIQLKGLDEQLRKLAERRKANDERSKGLAALQEEQREVQGKLKAQQTELEIYSQVQADIEGTEKEKAQHQEARDLYVANQQQAAELDNRSADLKKFETLLEELQANLAEKEDTHKKAGEVYSAEEHAALRKQKDELGREVGALDQKVKGLTAEVDRLAGEIGKLKKIEEDIAVKRQQIKAYKEKDELVKFLRNRVFRNVSAYLSERFREEISRRANRIYRIIAEVDEELAWGENYRIVLRDMVDGELRERADDQLSGGQTMSAVVALRLAMLQTIGARIAFFDEPTSNLDVTRRENLAHAFRAIDVGKEEVTEHWYDQLFLISHDVAFTEITDQILTLE